MKRIHILIVLAVAALVAVSCLKSTTKQNFTLDVSLEDDGLDFDPVDSTCFYPFIAFGNLVGFAAVVEGEKNEQLLGGFGLCRGVDPTLTGAAAKTPYHCIAHPYLASEKTFIAFRQSEQMPETHITFNVPNETSFIAPRGIMLNNTHDFVMAAKGLDGLSGHQFESGDWASVTFKGYLNNVETGTATIKMADFSGAKQEIVTEWTLLDLSPLGNVDRIDVALASSRDNAFRFVCMDHLNLSCSFEY